MPSPTPSLRIHQALDHLLAGGVIACPTEAVWGLSCDPADAQAVARLLQLKHRPVGKGLILVASREEQFAGLLEELSPALRGKLALAWPGPTTWLVPHRGLVPDWIHGDHETVALRVTAHPPLVALCEAWGGPLVSTSANPAGRRAPTAAFQVRRYFRGELDYLLPGPVGDAARPSVIRDLVSDRVLRA